MKNWYIGQEIVAIKDQYNGLFKEGDTFTIKSLRESPCACKNVDIHIGMYHEAKTEECLKCKSKLYRNTNIAWFNENSFKPLDELTDISELTAILEKEIFEV